MGRVAVGLFSHTQMLFAPPLAPSGYLIALSGSFSAIEHPIDLRGRCRF